MTQELSQNVDNQTLFSLVTAGDCSKLSSEQKLQYYKARCDAAGLDPRAQPFQFINLQGKQVLYALKAATDQLASKHGIVCEVVAQTTEQDIRTVQVRARAKDGRQTDEIGCVHVKGLQGDMLCNAYMKAVTKAKRRAVLSLCGLGMLDESETDTIRGAQETPLVVPDIPESLPESSRKLLSAFAPPEQPTETTTLVREAPVQSAESQAQLAEPQGVTPDMTVVRLKMEKIKSGEGERGPWTRYGYLMESDDGSTRWGGTFDHKAGAVLKEAMAKGARVCVNYTSEEYRGKEQWKIDDAQEVAG